MKVKEFNPADLTVNAAELLTVVAEANYLHGTTSANFEECAKKATALYHLTQEMKKGIVKFYYLKIDGSLREAYGTLKDVGQLIKGTGGKKDSSVQTYFDTQAGEFRSFKKANLVMNLKAELW